MNRQRPPERIRLFAAGACALAGIAVFQFFGNANRGYIDTSSLFHWWTYQWSNPASETEHGWLILVLSAWLLWRNLRARRIADCGLRIADSVGDSGNRIPESGRAQRAADAVSGVAGAAAIEGYPNPSPRPAQSAIRNPQSAILALLAGLAVHALGFTAQQARISILGLLLFTWGGLRLAGGRRWSGAAAFPLTFLIFAIPVNVLDTLGFWLRMGVVDASAAIARAAGIPVVQSGTQLFAPDGRYNYDVAAACSGVRSLTAMVALSLLAGYLNFQTTWRRAIALLLSLPLVYAGNVARILAIIFAAQVGGPAWGDIAHTVMGFGVFVIVLGGVLAALALLRRFAPEKDECHLLNDTSERAAADDTGECHLIDDTRAGARVAGRGGSREQGGEVGAVGGHAGRAALGGSGWLGAAAAIVVAAAVVEMAWLHRVASLPPRGKVGIALAADGASPVELPAFLGTEWIGRRAEVTAVEREILPPDTGFSRKLYVPVADPNRAVLLSIVLSGRDRTSIHRPELCLVGQGWTIRSAGEHRFRTPGGTRLPASLLEVSREVPTSRGHVRVPALTAYWFIGGDTIAATHWARIVRDGWNRVVHARADRWAYVLMQTDASDGEAAALARMQTVLEHTAPVFLPTDGGENAATTASN